MKDFKEYLEAIVIAFSKMNELKVKNFPQELIDDDLSKEYHSTNDNESILVKEYVFSLPKTFVFYRKIFTSISAKIFLIKNKSISGIQIVFDKESFFFEVGMGTGKNVTPFILLARNEILPSLEIFQNLLPLRTIEVAEMLGCDGFGCDGWFLCKNRDYFSVFSLKKYLELNLFIGILSLFIL